MSNYKTWLFYILNRNSKFKVSLAYIAYSQGEAEEIKN